MNDAQVNTAGAEARGAFRLRELRVFPDAGRMVGPGGEEQVDPKVMAVFEMLARNVGELVTRERLLDSIWDGRIVGDDVVSRCIYQLRRHLRRAGGSRSYRNLVKTLPKRGYLLDAALQALDQPADRPAAAKPRARRRHAWTLLAGLLLAAAAAWLLSERMAPDKSAQVGRVEPPTIAVLPFSDLSPAADHGYLADGFAEEIIDRLAGNRELRVIGRTSSFALRDSGYGSRQISELLGAQYLLEGSLRKDGDALRITAQLVDRNGVHLWGATFDRPLREIFATQSEIARVVADSIAPQIVPPGSDERLPNLEAYREYLVGKNMLARRTATFFEDAPRHFTRAIELDPAFAEAYAARAVSLHFSSFVQGDEQLQLEQAWGDVETALSLNPELAQAYAAKALLLERVNRGAELPVREALLRRALELDPTLPDAWNWLAGVLGAQGRYDEAERAMAQGLQVDPLAPILNINWAVEQARRGRAAEGLAQLERLLRLPHPSPMLSIFAVRLYVQSGRFSAALNTGKRLGLAASADAGYTAYVFPLITVYGQLGMNERATYWLERELLESPPTRYLPGRLFAPHMARDVLGYEETLARFRTDLAAAGVDAGDLPARQRGDLGMLAALNGEYAAALELLESVLEPEPPERLDLMEYPQAIDARLAQAWSWQQSGQSARAARMLRQLEDSFNEAKSYERLGLGDELAEAALTSLLLGDGETALKRLRRAVDGGWRNYYGIVNDPRWAAAWTDPAFRELIEQVRVDIERQRAAIEASDDHDAYVAQLDAAIAARMAEETLP